LTGTVKHVGKISCSAKCDRWYPAAVTRAVARKRCLWRKHRENPDDSKILAAYRKANRTYREEVRVLEIKREQWVIDRDNAGSLFRLSTISCRVDEVKCTKQQ